MVVVVVVGGLVLQFIDKKVQAVQSVSLSHIFLLTFPKDAAAAAAAV